MTLRCPTHPEFEKHGSFAHLKLGRLPSRHSPKLLQLAKYVDLDALLPNIPTECDLTKPVASWPMYDNDSLGDCTCAAVGHMVQAWTAANDQLDTPDPSLIDLLYWETGDPPASSGSAGGPTDTGRVETDVLDYWRKNGLGGGTPDRPAPLTAYAAVDPSNIGHVKAAIYLFGGVYTGIALPLSAQGQGAWDLVGDGKTGDSEPGSWGGHAVPYEAYDMDGIVPITWGAPIQASWAFHTAYTEEVYALISPDWFPAGKTPQGFDLAALQADLAAL